jgi:hypothetical protein
MFTRLARDVVVGWLPAGGGVSIVTGKNGADALLFPWNQVLALVNGV